MSQEDEKLKERKQDERDVNSFKNQSEQSSKKIKNPFTMLLRRIGALIAAIPLIVKLIVIIIIVSLISLGLAWIHDIFSSDVIADVASERILKEYVSVDNEPSFKGVPIGGRDDDGWVVKVKDLGYYLKLSKEAQEKYLEELNKSYIQGYYSMKKKAEEEVKSREEANLLYDPNDVEFNMKNIGKWFETEGFKDYFISMIKAEIESNVPKLSDYKGPIDSEGDYVAQGIGKLGRVTIDDNGNPSEDTYRMYNMAYDDFIEFLSECNAEQKDDVLYYFAYVPEEQAIYYATKTKIVTKVNGVVVSTEFKYELAGPFSYSSVVSLCSMPYNFLFSLMQTSENPEWIMAVIDLLEQSKVHVIIQDGLTITRTTEITDRGRKTVTTTQNLSTNQTSQSSSYEYPASGTTKETEITTYRNTATVFIRFAETWCMDVYATAIEEVEEGSITSEWTNPQTYTNADLEGMCTNLVSNYSNTDSETNTRVTTQVYESADILRYSKDEIVKIYKWKINSLSKINYDRFLGTWRNKNGTVGGGLYDPGGIEVKYIIPGMTVPTAIPPDNISDDTHQNINLLVELLRLHDNTQMHEMLMQYYWNIYNDKYIYNVDMDELMNFFNTDILDLGSSSILAGSMIENYIKAWENAGIWNYERGASSKLPSKYMTEDGQYYIVYEDGSNGHNNISFGIATFITNSKRVEIIHPKYGGGYYNWKSNFSSRGVDVTTLDTGSLVPRDVADAVYAEILAGFESKVDTYLSTHGLKLTQCQRDALVAVCYQYGNINGFKEAYDKSLDANGNINPEAIKNNFVLTSNNNVKPFNYSSTSDRKYANWALFTKETYVDSTGQEIKAVGGSILQCAKQIHDYMSDPAHLYYYCLKGTEDSSTKSYHVANGIKNCGLNSSFEESQIPGKKGYRLTCCATYVSWVLQAAGKLDGHSDGCSGLIKLLDKGGWTKITSYSQLQPGDIVFEDTNSKDGVRAITHVQIYVGDGTWYNAGNNGSIHTVAPERSNDSGVFIYAYRSLN